MLSGSTEENFPTHQRELKLSLEAPPQFSAEGDLAWVAEVVFPSSWVGEGAGVGCVLPSEATSHSEVFSRQPEPLRRLRKASSRGRHSGCCSRTGSGRGRGGVPRGDGGWEKGGEWGEGCVEGGSRSGPCALTSSSAGKYRLCCHAGVH